MPIDLHKLAQARGWDKSGSRAKVGVPMRYRLEGAQDATVLWGPYNGRRLGELVVKDPGHTFVEWLAYSCTEITEELRALAKLQLRLEDAKDPLPF